MTTIVVGASLKQRIAEVLSPHPIALAYLYGSAAAGRATPLSDVDIALVVIEDRAPKMERLRFELAVEDEIVRLSSCGRIFARSLFR
jgi:predicted nucleotidyltransferase